MHGVIRWVADEPLCLHPYSGVVRQMEPQFEQVGKAFIQHYYQAFDTNRAGLGDLYQAESMCVVPDQTDPNAAPCATHWLRRSPDS